MARIEEGVGAWLSGGVGEAPLRTLDTEFGPIRAFAVADRVLGPAWRVDGDYVVFSLSADMLVEYLRRVDDPTNCHDADAWDQDAHKFFAVRAANFANYYAGAGAAALKTPTDLPPMTIQTYESEQRVRFVMEQASAAAFLRAVAPLAARPSSPLGALSGISGAGRSDGGG
ncbi:MAG TPA: hypothetical protein ENO23_05915 [Alphaproteobacteria bacterium]|nr:hypothetical protein [Alphaproteobacteria bacterium]